MNTKPAHPEPFAAEPPAGPPTAPQVALNKDTVWADVSMSLSRWRLWRFLAFREITGQYRRTILGIAWIPFNVLIHVTFIGFIFSKLFANDRVLPFFAVGFSIWSVVSRVIAESATLWTSSEQFLRHIDVPLFVFPLKQTFKASVLLLMTLPIGIVYALFAGSDLTFQALYAVPGLIVLVVNLLWSSTLFSLISIGVRDIAKFTPSLLLILYLSTPIIWDPDRLTEHRWVADFNPIYHWIEAVRSPIVDGTFPMLSFAVSLAMAAAGSTIGLVAFALCRRRVVLWI